MKIEPRYDQQILKQEPNIKWNNSDVDLALKYNPYSTDNQRSAGSSTDDSLSEDPITS